MLVDLRVARLLCSRICHDLVGPVGAISAGLELLDQTGGADGDALGLMERSAEVARRRLQFFRSAYGIGGGIGRPLTLNEARALALGLLADRDVALDWPDTEAPFAGEAITEDGMKLLLNIILLGVEALPRGGTLGLQLAPLGEGIGAALTARGSGARVHEDVLRALAAGASAEALNPRNIHAYFAQKLSEHCGAAIEVSDAAEGEVRLALMLPCEVARHGAPGR